MTEEIKCRQHQNFFDPIVIHINQIYLVKFMCLTVDTRFIFTKKILQNVSFYISNTEIAQCCQQLDTILVTNLF